MNIRRYVLLMAIPAALLLFCAQSVAQDDDEDDNTMTAAPGSIIVEKNLFSPDRKKWEEPADKKPVQKQTVKKNTNINKINLYGTIIAGDRRYAVLRATKKRMRRGAGYDTPYQLGDYIEGYKIVEIVRKQVVLRDEDLNEDYNVFVSEEKKDRAALKTEIKQESADVKVVGEGAVSAKDTAQEKSEKKKPPKPKKAVTQKVLLKRMDRSLRLLKRRDSALVKKQAKRDLDRLKKLLPYMSDKEQEEYVKHRNEFKQYE